MLRTKAKAILLLSLALVLRSSGDAGRYQRDKRNALLPPLVYPFGGVLKLLMGHSMPIAMPGRILSFSQNLQFQFALPPNASFFTDYFSRRRRQAGELLHERAIFYELLENEVSRRGGPGKECVKRSICESASESESGGPGLQEQGLVGEILQLLLTPDQATGSTMHEYQAAVLPARRGEDCQRAYNCPKGFGLLDHISQLIDHH